MLSEQLEVWGYKTYRPFRIYWILKEYGLTYKSHKIGSRTGETQTNDYLKMNPKGKIPLLKHKNQIITESFAAVSYITYHFNKPEHFFIPNSSFQKAKIDEWNTFALMELDCLVIYTLRRHESPERMGLSNLYGSSKNAVKTAREHFDKMISACEKQVPNNNWLFGDKLSVADIILISCLMVCEKFDLKIKSDRVLEYLERGKNRKQYMEAYEDCFSD